MGAGESLKTVASVITQGYKKLLCQCLTEPCTPKSQHTVPSNSCCFPFPSR